MVCAASLVASLLAVVANPLVVAAESIADAATNSAVVASLPGSEKVACGLLNSRYPKQTYYSGSDGYTYETQTQYWSATEYNTPACVFVPQNAQQVSFAVTTLTLSLTKFAVRSGGHMPVVGYNSIGSSGVLLSTSNLTTLTLSSDKSTVSVGAGYRWRDVYSYLAPSGLAVVGGRIGGVGVPGLLLGGGISFYSNQYGFAADNVVRYQAVLSSGLVVEATATNAYSDLFWALKGGGNSFAIVTRFDLKTFVSPKVWVGISQYAQADSAKYLDAVYNFGKFGSADGKAAIIPTILTYPSYNITAYAAARFYDSETAPATAFENFTSPALTPVADSYALQPLADYVTAVDALQPTGLRQEFRVMSLVVNRDAVDYVHDTFLAATGASLTGIVGLSASITFQPITKEFIQQGVAKGGNPQGVDPSKAPYFWVVENLTWQDAKDDAAVKAFADSVTAEIEAGLVAKGVAGGYLYLNDAGQGQKIFQSYPAANLAKLKAIRAKYDPLRIYTNLLVGGWKVLDA
ncbi:FAD binding domain-containing protein [Colletotrichum scovillei]|uniref:FAD binding domain-containing protein n=1 Tax=Colletotrichum scovillei TaxID=1209932 RepID=A0A9P7R2P1_9PEZI|nr:FAD binding domain-containing protein [Colletotrichum scovillei]KAF4774453.1 FAD binding domain-containing protein [Colletotrichum scovillei]KAG7048426.1 FAD binding domain-containing protein [Colletotrichum scovillei]KAG7065592.1 FAD binding domain-containing protein [Colletotrichum scovillei]KAG7068191.1 FAD binding domain-containing protein [Colletotrichum scovillei]